MIDRVLPCFTSIASLATQRSGIETGLRELLGALPRVTPAAVPSLRSTLTGGRYPVELSLLIDEGRAVGLKYTVDLLACDSLPSLLDAVGRISSAPELHRWLRLLWERSAGNLAGVYLSVSFTAGAPPSLKVHVVGEDDAFDRAVLEGLEPGLARREALDGFLEAMAAFGVGFARVIGLGVVGDRVVGCKCYLGTPYLDLRTVSRLATALRLPVGHGVALLRWYRRFIGPHWGQLGSFGVGINLSREPRADGLEAYAYPSPLHLEALRQRLDRYAGDGLLAPLWSLAPGTASLQLGGCGVETASFGRLGRMTVYFSVSADAEP